MKKVEKIDCICKTCKKSFKRLQSRIVKGRGKYCSKKCGYAGLRGRRHSEEAKMKMSNHANVKGSNSPMWKGGTTTKSGYNLIHTPTHPYCDRHGYVREHRLVMEKHLGRTLLPMEVVHHINNDKKDNRITNLMLFSSNSEHTIHHHRTNDEE